MSNRLRSKRHELLYSRIGRRIASVRYKRGLSQSELAEGMGYTGGSIANIERGCQRPPIHFLYELSQFLKVPLRELLPWRLL